MPMEQNGLGKLLEEMGEVAQIAGKMIGYPHLQLQDFPHPDGTILRRRLEEEIGDVLAACTFVSRKLDLSGEALMERAEMKIELFEKWDKE